MTGKTSKKSAKLARKASPAGGEPILLSGGNPQIAKADGDAPVQAYIEAMPGWKRDVGRRLDALIVRNAPNVRKAVRWNSPFYGIEGQGWFLAFHCITKYVKVAFLRGAALRPLPPVESKSEGARYFHIHEGDSIDEELVGSWIRQASVLPGEHCFESVARPAPGIPGRRARRIRSSREALGPRPGARHRPMSRFVAVCHGVFFLGP